MLFPELYTKEIFQLFVSAYSTISVEDAALFLGMSEDGATSYVLQQGWTVDNASRMLTVKKQPVVSAET
ncbi:COP9 signalosome complex subunit 8 [Medicago truncatula]|uniref:COP9 signalosome complex subunit 8 n=1 Tax=Medicago truncatula TaxID=3880 RepID=A0A072V3P0_MEDTR|nr:COP9 signalosome complex subunit 8 [Medicago truncatula]